MWPITVEVSIGENSARTKMKNTASELIRGYAVRSTLNLDEIPGTRDAIVVEREKPFQAEKGIPNVSRETPTALFLL